MKTLAAYMRSGSRVEADRIASYVCINSLNLLSEFNRAYFALALENAKTRSGTIVCTQFPKNTSVHTALSNLNLLRPRGRASVTRRNEPAWHSMPRFLDVLQLAAVTTEGQVRVAMGLQVRVLGDLPTIRNFFAHRNGETAQKSRRMLTRFYSVPTNHPVFMLGSFSTGRPTTILEDWMAELEIVFDTMSQ